MADQERALQKLSHNPLFLVRPGMFAEVGNSRQLGEALSLVAKELKSLPPTRSEESDLPEEIRYLISPEAGFLIMVSRRRPPTNYLNAEDHLRHDFHFGYFVEAFELDGRGSPRNSVTDPFKLNSGAYQRVEVSDKGVPNDLEDQYPEYSELGLTPTDFSSSLNLARELQSNKQRDQFTQGRDLGSKNIVSALFLQSEKARARMGDLERDQRMLIVDKFNAGDNHQGLSNEIGQLHLLISDEGTSSPLFQISQELGFETIAVPFVEAMFGKHNILRYIGDLTEGHPAKAYVEQLEREGLLGKTRPRLVKKVRAQYGKYPLMVTYDARSLRKQLSDPNVGLVFEISSLLGLDAKWIPIFSLIELHVAPEEREFSKLTRRFSNGTYHYYDPEVENIRKLYTKVVTDYSLTQQVRALTQLV